MVMEYAAAAWARWTADGRLHEILRYASLRTMTEVTEDLESDGRTRLRPGELEPLDAARLAELELLAKPRVMRNECAK